ncbi:Dicer-like protein [Drosera capensis]
MSHLIEKPQKQICVFLAPTVPLVHQQAGVIADSIDFSVRPYGGDIKLQRSHDEWEKELEQYEVYYPSKAGKLPRIFGMTASPVLGKGASIDSLETLFHAKVCTVDDKEELEIYVSSPVVRLYPYRSNIKCSSYEIYLKKLKAIKRQCSSLLCRNEENPTNTLRVKKLVQRTHNSLAYCLGCLGVWGVLMASRVLLSGDQLDRSESNEAIENPSDSQLCNEYLEQAASMFNACIEDAKQPDISDTRVLKEPFFSAKVLKLIEILSNFRARPDMKCIVFVNRIVVARSLSFLLQQLKILTFWRSGFLVGQHSGLKGISRRNTNSILEQFRSGELNLLVATKVGEEGLDIQTCSLVVRFDLPETVASFIQSRGRARMPQSEFAVLVDSDNEKEKNIIDVFLKEAQQMNVDIMTREPREMIADFNEKVYKVKSTGATISVHSSVSLLHRYCSKLPHDEYYKPKLEFYYVDDVEGKVCHAILPANAPIHQISSVPESSIEAAKRDACLEACKELHQIGALSDYLLPYLDSTEEKSALEAIDSDSSDDEDAGRDEHDMLVPGALTKQWNVLEEPVCLNSYFVRFTAKPHDRQYKEFGLFIKAPLPSDAEKLELDLHLAHGRSVITELLPSGVTQFDQEEIALAQNFQEMFLKLVLNRTDFTASVVTLGKDRMCRLKSGTVYLLLPVIWNQYKSMMVVDWKVIRRCLSSSIFSSSTDVVGRQFHHDEQLQLVDGPCRTNDIVNSLVYVAHKSSFFFITQVLPGKNGYSSFDNSRSHVEHLSEAHQIHLCYPEQSLLQAKQLANPHNWLHDRKHGNEDPRALEEHFFELPPEVCHLKILGFSKEIGSSVSLLPSVMHRLENLLVAIELRSRLADSFPEGAEVTSQRVLEALTTERCSERFSLERLEVLGDAFLKFAVSRHLFLAHEAMDEGQLTSMRSKLVNNMNLYKLATRRKLQVYIRDREFNPQQFCALGRPCSVISTNEMESSNHTLPDSRLLNGTHGSKLKGNKHQHWLQRKTIADVVEALIGAYLVDGGFKSAISFLQWIGIRADFETSQVIHACTLSASFMPVAALLDVPSLEGSLSYHFIHRGLLLQAFIHPSYNKHGGGCYQRLEFLGDAVMDYLITSFIYSAYPKLKPGQLTDLRSVLVSNASFAGVAVKLSFHKHIICDCDLLCDAIDKYVNYIRVPDSERDQLEEPPCPKALGDLVESSIGAIFLDTGFDLDRVYKLVLFFFDPILSFSKFQFNPVRELKELCQCFNWELKFSSLKKNKNFTVEVRADCEDIGCPSASATNRSKKAAKRVASQEVLEKLQAEGYKARTKSLKEVLKISPKMEAELIGFDEKPVSTVPAVTSKLESFSLEDLSSSCSIPDTNSLLVTRNTTGHDSHAKPATEIGPVLDRMEKSRASPSTTRKKRVVDLEAGSSPNVTPKSKLLEICAANCWNPPAFECCKEEGPSHLRLFTYKVVVQIEDDPCTILECFGKPHSKKKAAADNAAEAALWLLKKERYI